MPFPQVAEEFHPKNPCPWEPIPDALPVRKARWRYNGCGGRIFENEPVHKMRNGAC